MTKTLKAFVEWWSQLNGSILQTIWAVSNRSALRAPLLYTEEL